MIRRFSHSSLDTYRQCPRKFKFQKIEKVEVPRQLLAHNYLGTTVHTQLAAAYRWAHDGKSYPLDDMLANYEADWEESVRRRVVPGAEHLTVDDYIEAGRKMLRAFHVRFQPFDRGVLLGAEMNLPFELERCPAGFTTRVDRVMKRPDGVYEICDYKTGKEMARGPSDPNFRQQMGMYQLAVQKTWADFEPIEISQYFLRHEEFVRCRLRPDELDELAEQFRAEVAEIFHAEKIDDWPTREGGHCRFCDYESLCPAKRHRKVLEEEGEEDDTVSPSALAAELADRYLEIDGQKKTLEAELKALREELIQIARDLELSRIVGNRGDVTVSIRPTEKFPTKSRDPLALAELTALVRGWGLDTCLKLDDTALKSLYTKGRLTADQLASLEEFITLEEGVTVRAVPRDSEEDEE
jgi:putative RecB family exonuclease